MWRVIYADQTCRYLKTRFTEQYFRMMKSCKIYTFLYRHFKHTDHVPSQIFIQPVKKILYADNSSKLYRNILGHELEL